MFGGDPFGNDENEEEENEEDFLSDPFSGGSSNEQSSGGGMLGGGDPNDGRLPWERLDDDEAEEIKERSETPMCEHDSDRQVITKQSGAGVQVAGTGSNLTTTVTKVVCPTCGGEWDTWDGSSRSSTQDPFSL